MSRSPNAECAHCGTALYVIGDGRHPIKSGRVFCPGSACVNAWATQQERSPADRIAAGVAESFRSMGIEVPHSG